MESPGLHRFLQFLILCSFGLGSMGCTSLEKIFIGDGTVPFIELSVDTSSLGPISKETTMVNVNYRLNEPLEDFERRIDASGEIVYKISSGKFCGQHSYHPEMTIGPLEESGVIPIGFSSSFGEGFATGEGHLIIGGVKIYYTDKANKKHKGYVSYAIRIPVVFSR